MKQEEEEPDYTIPNDVCYQFSMISRMFGGRPGFYTYQVAVCLLMFGGIWSYGTVIAQSLTSVIPFTFLPRYDGLGWQCSDPCQNYKGYCSDAYWIWICVIGVVSVILMFFNLAEQKIVQSIATFMRFLLLGMTSVVIIYCLSSQPFLDKSSYTGSTYINPNVKMVSFSLQSFGSLFGSIMFSQIYQHAAPSIFQFTRPASQPKLKSSVIVSSVFLTCIMALIAFPGALYFGNDGANLVTVNFNVWDGNGFSGGKQHGFVAFLSYTLRLLPPIYVLFTVPL